MPQSFSAATAIIYSGGTKIGRANSISWTVDIQQVDVNEFGEIDVVEHVATARVISGQAGFISIKANGLGNQGIVPRGQNNSVEVVNFPPMTWQLYDEADSLVIATLDFVVPTTQSFRMDFGNLLAVDMGFKARKFYDEQGS